MVSNCNDDTVVGDFVLVSWIDASFDLDEPPTPLPMETVGWITVTNDEWVTVAQERDGAGTFLRAHTAIPRSLIQAIHRVSLIRE